MPERPPFASPRRTQRPVATLYRHFPLALLCTIAAMSIHAPCQMDEYSIKAGYLYNFSKYVEWPEGSFAASDAPFLICLLGDDPFGQRLDQAIAGKVSGDGRPLQVKRLKDPDRATLRDCRILFLSKSEKAHLAAIMDLLKNTSIFSVADFDSFAEKGGTADLRIDGTRVKFDLNVNIANHANLKISARLQQVANLVH